MLSSEKFPELVEDVTLGLSIPGVALSVLLLAAIAFLQWNPVSRPYLDRVSFRLLVYALVANVIFGSLMFFNMKETSPGCSFVAFLYGTTPMFSACVFCCMAVNLQLVLIHGVNGSKMEKYYLSAAAFLCGACNIPPLIAGEFGWYATTGKCWLREPTPAVQQHWMIGTQSVPMILMSAIEGVSFMNILIFMLLQACVHRRAPISHHFHMNLRIFNACVYSIRPLLYALLAATDPSVPSPRSKLQTATTVSFEWAQKCSRTSSAEQETSSAGDCERRPSTVEEVLI
ncbi:hypothetical protein B0H13DRAFT_1862504 [Mycena leptocephala]|nr:hypothetical protein B0H13DRAFT_1862504 [Mycena leptocephala]